MIRTATPCGVQTTVQCLPSIFPIEMKRGSSSVLAGASGIRRSSHRACACSKSMPCFDRFEPLLAESYPKFMRKFGIVIVDPQAWSYVITAASPALTWPGRDGAQPRLSAGGPGGRSDSGSTANSGAARKQGLLAKGSLGRGGASRSEPWPDNPSSSGRNPVRTGKRSYRPIWSGTGSSVQSRSLPFLLSWTGAAPPGSSQARVMLHPACQPRDSLTTIVQYLAARLP
ncbi:hypothetical protein OA50_01901 [Mameliella alba]|uniref:Uncharacterized protein n=1 Tax=Mameliella alba TaxID=561184 RepID=A0A0B3RZ65_9RHOB|nr:hypothetical protein OA50_01901 [Mameliella alba]